MSLLREGARALVWSALGELGARVLGPLTFIVLARVLLPEDFGVVAAATVVVSFAQAIGEGGFAKALVQRQNRVAEAAHTAFWLNAALGGVLMVAAWLTAPAVAAFFGDARVAVALRALAPLMLLHALAAVPMALMQRDLRFKPLFWGRTVGALLPALAGIPLALAGGGYWALVAGTLAGQVALTAFVWAACRWRPALTFDRVLAVELLRFARWVVLSALFGWGYGWIDAVVVGRFLGTHDMGLYRTGNTLVTLVFGVVFAPLAPVLYSMFSRAQHDLDLLRRSLLIVVRVVVLVALPISLSMYWLSAPIVSAVLGEAWRGAGLVVGMLALAQGASWLVAFNGELYRAVGRPQAEAWIMGPTLAVYGGAYLLAVRYGLDGVLWCRLALAVLGIAIHVLVARYVVAIPVRHWLQPVAATLVSLAVAILVSAPLALALCVLFGAAEWPLVRSLAARWRAGTAAPAPKMENLS